MVLWAELVSESQNILSYFTYLQRAYLGGKKPIKVIILPLSSILLIMQRAHVISNHFFSLNVSFLGITKKIHAVATNSLYIFKFKVDYNFCYMHASRVGTLKVPCCTRVK